MTAATKFLRLCILPAVTCLVACSTTVQTGSESRQPAPRVGILLYGDSGYLLEYPDQDDYEDLFTEEQYLQSEWDSWVEDKRPPDEYRARPMAVSPVTGGVVPATGMHAVSRAMKNYCAGLARCDFGLLLGDNIYPSGLTFGADGFDDAAKLNDMFTVPFGELVVEPEGFVTYVALGNHDWETSREGGFAQIEFLENAGGFYMDGPFYSVKPPAGNGEVELFVIDTSMLLASVPVYEDYLDDSGAEVVTDIIAEPDYFVQPLSESERNMALWLENALRNSTAKWKIVAAHHPIWSSSGSKFEQGRALRQLILPAMCRYADAYIVGHDHTLEIHTDDCSAALGVTTGPPLVQIVSGAASKQRPVNTNFIIQQDEKYPEHKTVWAKGLLWGFAFLDIQGDDARVSLLSIPDDGSSDITVEFTYEFKRRSASNHVRP